MNDPSKRIDVNLSSLLSLKAELLRKHEEVSKAKSTHLISNFIPTKKKNEKLEKKSTKVQKIDQKSTTNKNNHCTEEYENSELLQKSKKILEAKAQLYNKMMESGGSLNSDDNCLVMFNQKKQSATLTNYSYDNDDDDADGNDDDDNWVEYTDCLGRTRKCLKEDLEFFKKKDVDLADTVAERNEKNAEQLSTTVTKTTGWFIDKKGKGTSSNNDDGFGTSVNNDNDDTISVISSKMSKIDEMRTNWEQQEEKNVQKDFVHYQDILFNEARTHGVGYYGFSSNDQERAKQQQEFETIRRKTLAAQQKRETFRKSRETIVAERVKAAKNRQRARLGLPPLDDSPDVTIQSNEILLDVKNNEQLSEKLLIEKQRNDERKKIVRPWDKGKLGSVKQQIDTNKNEWTYRPEKEPYSQEQWNELKRSERNKEFAPMDMSSNSSIGHSKQFNDYGEGYFKTPINEPLKKRPFIRRPIYKNDDNDDNDDCYNDIKKQKYTEIPPPPTFDYYGPASNSDGKHRKSERKNCAANLESSIEAGLKFLRQQSDKDTLSTKMKWTANADMK